MRTLVVMPNWVGDAVMAEPVVRALAGSGRETVLFAKRPLAPLVRLFAGVADVVERQGDDRADAERLRGGGFDEAVVLPHSFRSAKLVRAAGIPRRIGYRGDFRAPLLAPAVRRPRGKGPQIEDYGSLLATLGVAAPASWVPRLELPSELRERGRERLGRAHIELGRGPLVGLFPGAEWGSSKRWPWRRFAALATTLRGQVPELRQVIVAGPKEVWLAVRVHEESGHLHPVVGPEARPGGARGSARPPRPPGHQRLRADAPGGGARRALSGALRPDRSAAHGAGWTGPPGARPSALVLALLSPSLSARLSRLPGRYRRGRGGSGGRGDGGRRLLNLESLTPLERLRGLAATGRGVVPCARLEEKGARMEIQTRRSGTVQVISVDGKLTIESGSAMYDAILAALGAGEKNILLDLHGVKALDSSGVGELVASLTSARNRGAKLKLLQLAPRVGNVLKTTQLIGLFDIFEDEGAAIRSFG